jgi:hypothetical protein
MNAESYKPARCHGEDCNYPRIGEPCWGQVEWEDDISTAWDEDGEPTDSEPLFACEGHTGSSGGHMYRPEPL